jgi:hypothetical protein
MFTITYKIGDSVLTYQSNDIKSIHKVGSVYGALPKKCDACGKKDIYLSYKSPKGNDFYTLVCSDCGAELHIHQKRDGGLYIKWGEKMEKYSPNKTINAPQQNSEENGEKDNVPF